MTSRRRRNRWRTPTATLSQVWPGDQAAMLAGIAAALVLIVSLPVQHLQRGARPLDPAGLALAVVAALALAWTPRFPRTVLAIVGAAVCAYLAIGYPYGPVQLCLFAAIFGVGRRISIWPSVAACVLTSAAVAASLYPRLARTGRIHSPEIVVAVWTASWLVVPWLLGALLRARAATRALREQLVAEAVWAERMRLARDVHDVAGHGFAVIAMQAGVALLTAEERPEQIRVSLEAIHATSTHALAELRTTLGTFAEPRSGGSPRSGPPTQDSPDPRPTGDATTSGSRTTDGTPPGPGDPATSRQAGPAAASAGLHGRLERLAAGVRSAGVAVNLDVDPRLDEEPDEEPDGNRQSAEIDEVICRVVQESLTNVLQHANAAPTTITLGLDGDSDEVTVTVADRGPGAARGPAGDVPRAGDARPGQGIPGMRDRLLSLGGSLTTDSPPAGGFTVSARVPRFGPRPHPPALRK